MILHDQAIIQNDDMKATSECMVKKSDGMKSHGSCVSTDHSDASGADSECSSRCLSPECGLPQSFEEKSPSQEKNQEWESGAANGHFLEPLEQPEQFEECTQAIVTRKIPQTTFLRRKTPFVSSLSDCVDDDLDDAEDDSSAAQMEHTDSPMTASVSESYSTSGSVSPRFIAPPGNAWREDSVCVVCRLELGKRKLRPRHHCRICWGSVCANCSPSRVPLVGEKLPQRVCNPCVLQAELEPVSRESSGDFNDQLGIIDSLRSPLSWVVDTLENAMLKCESALLRLDYESADHTCTKKEAEEVKTRCVAEETLVTEAEMRLKQLRVELRVVKAELQETPTIFKGFSASPGCSERPGNVHSQPAQDELACERRQSRVWACFSRRH